KSKMKGFHIGRVTQIASWLIATIIVSLNAKLVYSEIVDLLKSSENPTILWFTVVPLALSFLILLLYIVFKPFISKPKNDIQNHSPHHLKLQFSPSGTQNKKDVAISVDFSNADEAAINSAFELGGKEAKYTLIHVVETIGAMIYGDNIEDCETTIDEKLLAEYKTVLTEKGFKVETKLGFGKPNKVISEIINQGTFDILVMGTHGHTGLKDLVFGTTVDKLRHAISIPLYIVKM
ncbi:MAG: universal stress protein, partial [Flavobacterium sp.]